MPIKRIYFVSGLGADERVFQFLEIPEVEKIHIHWIPTIKGESLQNYCQKLIQQIPTVEDSAIVGVSFGGIVAQEIAKLLDFKLVIIISSVKSISEFPWHFRLMRWIRIDKAIPEDKNAISKTHGITEKMFGVQNEKEKKILRAVLDDIDPIFIKWAIGAMMGWNQKVPEVGLIHIHGDLDKVFPTKNIKNYIKVIGGGHLMLLNRAKEISEIIQSKIKQ